jgi:integrase
LLFHLKHAIVGAKGNRYAPSQGSLLLLKGCSVFYAQFYQNGKQVRLSTGKRVKQEALVELRRLMGRADQGLTPVTELRKITYGQLRDGLIASYQEKGNRTLYQTADGEETIGGLKALDAFFGYDDKNPGPPVTAITTDSGRAFAKRQLAAGFSTATINRSLACLRRMLAIAREDGKLQSVPLIRLLKEPPARRGFVTQKQFDELLAALPTHLRPLIQFLYWCGCRLGEARAIQWEQVNLQERLIRLEPDQTKNETARVIPLPSVVAEELSRIKPKTGTVFDDTNLRTEWAKACTAVGLGTMEDQESAEGNKWSRYSGLIIHDLRRSAIRNMVAAGNPENWCMAISGHKTASVFRRYAIVSTADITTAMQRVEAVTLKASSKKIGVKSVKNLPAAKQGRV